MAGKHLKALQRIIIFTITIFFLYSIHTFAQDNFISDENTIKVIGILAPQNDSLLKVSSPSESIKNVTLINHLSTYPCYAIFLKDSVVYFGKQNYLLLFNINVPINPKEVSRLQMASSGIYGIFVTGGYAYVANGSQGLRVIDVRNIIKPVSSGFYNPSYQSAYEVITSGRYSFVAMGYDGVRVVDVNNPTRPSEIFFYLTGGFVEQLFMSGNYLYTASGTNGLRILDILNPGKITEAGYYDTPGNFVNAVFVSDKYTYVADREKGIQILDVKYVRNPVKVDSIAGSGKGIFVSDYYAYVADYENGLRIIDISNPTCPVEVAFYNINGHARRVIVYRDVIYLADEVNGLYMLKNDLLKISFSQTNYDFSTVPVKQSKDWNTFRITNRDSVSLIIDSVKIDSTEFSVSSSRFPITIKPGDSTQITIRFTPVTAGSKSATLNVYTNTPYMPVRKIYLSGTSYYLTAIDDQNTKAIPEYFTLHQNYPNPFNSETSIQYDLPKRERVSIRIYNVVGKLVRTLIQEEQFPGNYTTQWDGRDDSGRYVSSGIYIYRVQAGGFEKSKKMVFLK